MIIAWLSYSCHFVACETVSSNKASANAAMLKVMLHGAISNDDF